MRVPEARLTRQQRRATERATKRRERKSAKLAGSAVAVGALLAAGNAAAATFTVTNLNDSGAGSLRDAISSANAAAGADVIIFQAGLTGTITLTTGEIPITESVAINGPGSGVVTVSGNNASRVFDVDSIASPQTVSINNLSLTAGNATAGPNAPAGGAIRSSATNLSLDHLVITNNTAPAGGGGVYWHGLRVATLSVTNSTISGNTTANGGGGGLAAYYAYASVYLKGDTFNANSAGRDGGGVDAKLYAGGSFTMLSSVVTNNVSGTTPLTLAMGGGVEVAGYYGGSLQAAVIADSVISGNIGDPNDAAGSPLPGTDLSDKGYGGGLSLNHVAATVRRTTVSGNTAFSGGGVQVTQQSQATFANVTVANNLATSPISVGYGGGVRVHRSYFGGTAATFNETTVSGNTAEGGGGGIHVDAVGPDFGSATATLYDSIVANNTGDPTLNEVSGSVTATYTLFENPGSATILNGTGDIVGVDPQLGALAANGSTIVAGAPGSTQTPLTELQACGSPVINAGDPAFAPPPSTDERGFPRVAEGRIDMGAVELQQSTISLAIAAASVAENGGSITVTVSRTGSADGAVSVNYATADGTAIAGSDYTATTGTLTWASGDMADKTIVIPILDDAIPEANETFTLTISTPTCGALLGRIPAETITIIDNDVPSLSINNVTQPEGNSGTTPFTFTVTMSVASTQTVTVNYATANGTATAGSDYTATSGTLTFTPGQTQQTITVPVIGDTTVEPDETFAVNLSGAVNAAIATATGTGTIQNDDSATVDVAIAKTASGTTFYTGQTMTFNIVVTNPGASAATSVVVTDVLPATSTFVSATPSQGTCSGTTTVTCSLGAIASGGSATIALQLTPNSAGPLSNTATVSAAPQTDTNLTNNSSTASAVIRPSAAIPTLGEWGKILLGLAVALAGVFGIRKR